MSALTGAALHLIDNYIDGKECCEDCGQLMRRSYPLGLPEGAFVLVCAGCGTNMNSVSNPDMRYCEDLYAKD